MGGRELQWETDEGCGRRILLRGGGPVPSLQCSDLVLCGDAVGNNPAAVQENCAAKASDEANLLYQEWLTCADECGYATWWDTMPGEGTQVPDAIAECLLSACPAVVESCFLTEEPVEGGGEGEVEPDLHGLLRVYWILRAR